MITGCYDWLHSGHIRFFMDAAAYGALYAVVGSDRNVELLKGPGTRSSASRSGGTWSAPCAASTSASCRRARAGWTPSRRSTPSGRTFYVVNEDGDQPEKREFCRAHGIEYVVLQRVPHAGLQPRSSTELRGF